MKSLPVFELHEENNQTNQTNNKYILFRYPLKNKTKTKNKSKTKTKNKTKKWSKIFSL